MRTLEQYNMLDTPTHYRQSVNVEKIAQYLKLQQAFSPASAVTVLSISDGIGVDKANVAKLLASRPGFVKVKPRDNGKRYSKPAVSYFYLQAFANLAMGQGTNYPRNLTPIITSKMPVPKVVSVSVEEKQEESAALIKATVAARANVAAITPISNTIVPTEWPKPPVVTISKPDFTLQGGLKHWVKESDTYLKVPVYSSKPGVNLALVLSEIEGLLTGIKQGEDALENFKAIAVLTASLTAKNLEK